MRIITACLITFLCGVVSVEGQDTGDFTPGEWARQFSEIRCKEFWARSQSMREALKAMEDIAREFPHRLTWDYTLPVEFSLRVRPLPARETTDRNPCGSHRQACEHGSDCGEPLRRDWADFWSIAELRPLLEVWFDRSLGEMKDHVRQMAQLSIASMFKRLPCPVVQEGEAPEMAWSDKDLIPALKELEKAGGHRHGFSLTIPPCTRVRVTNRLVATLHIVVHIQGTFWAEWDRPKHVSKAGFTAASTTVTHDWLRGGTRLSFNVQSETATSVDCACGEVGRVIIDGPWILARRILEVPPRRYRISRPADPRCTEVHVGDEPAHVSMLSHRARVVEYRFAGGGSDPVPTLGTGATLDAVAGEPLALAAKGDAGSFLYVTSPSGHAIELEPALLARRTGRWFTRPRAFPRRLRTPKSWRSRSCRRI